MADLRAEIVRLRAQALRLREGSRAIYHIDADALDAILAAHPVQDEGLDTLPIRERDAWVAATLRFMRDRGYTITAPGSSVQVEHDRQVAAQALRDAADNFDRYDEVTIGHTDIGSNQIPVSPPARLRAMADSLASTLATEAAHAADALTPAVSVGSITEGYPCPKDGARLIQLDAGAWCPSCHTVWQEIADIPLAPPAPVQVTTAEELDALPVAWVIEYDEHPTHPGSHVGPFQTPTAADAWAATFARPGWRASYIVAPLYRPDRPEVTP